LAVLLFFAFGGAAFARSGRDLIPCVPRITPSTLVICFPTARGEFNGRPTRMPFLTKDVLVSDKSRKENMTWIWTRDSPHIPSYVSWERPIHFPTFPFPRCFFGLRGQFVNKFVAHLFENSSHPTNVYRFKRKDYVPVSIKNRLAVTQENIGPFQINRRLFITPQAEPANDGQTESKKYKSEISKFRFTAQQGIWPIIVFDGVGCFILICGVLLLALARGVCATIGLIFLCVGGVILVWGASAILALTAAYGVAS